jgi:hypothetical protein
MRAILNLLKRKKEECKLQPMGCHTCTPDGWDGTWNTAEKNLDELRANIRVRMAVEREMMQYRMK